MSGLEIVAVAAALVVATALLMAVVLSVWWFDRYDREPLPLLLAVLFWGIVMAPALVGAAAALDILPRGAGAPSLTASALIYPAAALEEAAKGLAILLVLLFSRHFDNPTDGLVYGTAVGLGFAMTENVFHAIGASSANGAEMVLTTIAGRTLYTAGIHALSSSVFGGALGLALLAGHRLKAWAWGIAGFALAVALHGGWNHALLELPGVVAGGSRTGVILAPLYFLYVAIFGLLLHAEHRILIRQLAEEVRLGVLPGWTVTVIPYYRRRIRANWWPSRRERAVISRLLTKLAFCKHALASSGAGPGDLAGLELVSLRERAQKILGPSEEEAEIDV